MSRIDRIDRIARFMIHLGIGITLGVLTIFLLWGAYVLYFGEKIQ